MAWPSPQRGLIHKTGHARGPSRGRRKRGRGCLFCLLAAPPPGQPVSNVHTPARAPRPWSCRRPGTVEEVASRVSQGDRARLGARACPECVCARPGVCARDRSVCITRSRGVPRPGPRSPSPADTHRTAAAGAGRGGPRPQSFPAVRTGGVLGPEAAASASPSHRLGLRSQLAAGGLRLKGWGAGLSLAGGGAPPHWPGRDEPGGDPPSL